MTTANEAVLYATELQWYYNTQKLLQNQFDGKPAQKFGGGIKNKSLKRFTSGRTKRRKSIKRKIIIEVRV